MKFPVGASFASGTSRPNEFGKHWFLEWFEIVVSWYRLEIGDAVLAEEELAEIRCQGETEFERAGRPSGWSVYLAHVSGNLHCRAHIYFSPAAGQLARRLGARPCNAPPEGLELLAGDAG